MLANGKMSGKVPTVPGGGRAGTAMRYLLADIGGTNARFALLEKGAAGAIETLKVAAYPQAGDAIVAFLERHQATGTIAGAAIGVAGPVEDGRCAFTNSDWVVDAAELKAAFGFGTVQVINDFAAIGLSLPHLTGDDLFGVGADKRRREAPEVVLGPGTGLGVACLLRRQPPLVVASEGGHVTLASTEARQAAVLGWLRNRFEHVSAERALSGEGLASLHDSIAGIDGRRVPSRSPAEVTQAALGGGCPVSREALDMFCALLGSFAGDMALTFGAAGGVYIAGGIVPRFAEHLARSEFRSRFEAKGRFRDWLAAIPVHVIRRSDPAFVGLAALAVNADPAP